MLARRQVALPALCLILAACFACRTSPASEQSVVELSADLLAGFPPNLTITFCTLDMAEDSMAVLNEDDLDHRRAPWSTFKIPNLIIALETGVAEDLDHRRDWDRQRRPAASSWPPAWKQDHSLASAFKQSVVWYFRDIATEVGTARYRRDLSRFGYGNASVPVNSDDFWLGGPLAISPREQTRFLKRALNGSLAISDRARDALRKVSLMEAAGGHAVFGKTGSGRLENGRFEGWLVGWVERDDRPAATFALHMQAPSFRSLQSARLDIAATLLQAAGYLPQGWK